MMRAHPAPGLNGQHKGVASLMPPVARATAKGSLAGSIHRAEQKGAGIAWSQRSLGSVTAQARSKRRMFGHVKRARGLIIPAPLLQPRAREIAQVAAGDALNGYERLGAAIAVPWAVLSVNLQLAPCKGKLIYSQWLWRIFDEG